ncbi:hypothetical protein KVT40_007333 [Elsinoe batatas]|uniref:Pentatricopeptide repeat protein n=1 Tax=Elsinoe batatas TaxID=2601811 RepID=A0A8K0KUJ1_9PEZI|nr:hypothetical protein KVT40_007333 [Elsinoe batatas]
MSLSSISASRGAPIPSPQCLRFLKHLIFDRPQHGKGTNRSHASSKERRGSDGRLQHQEKEYKHAFRHTASVGRSATTTMSGLESSQRCKHEYHRPRWSRNPPVLSATGTRAHSTSSKTRRYSAAAAQAIEVPFTEEELESVLAPEEKPPDPRKEEPQGDPRQQGRTRIRDDRHIAQIRAKVEANAEEKTRLQTTKQTYLITRHMAQHPGRPRKIEPLDEKTAPSVFRFGQLLTQPTPDKDQVWSAYTLIPSPRVCYISEHLLTDFLSLLRRTKSKPTKLVEQYFTVMSDMTSSSRPLTHRDFNSSLHWIGRSPSLDPTTRLERALSLFHQFESTPSTHGDIVTFNTLGVLALKAKSLPLVRTLLNTITTRHLQPDRYTHLLRITYYGRQRSVPGIRSAYKSMLLAGELIDTIALNAVIRALLDAADLPSALATFARMKALHTSRRPSAVPADDWVAQRRSGHVLKYTAWQLRHHRELRREVQDATPVTPDAHTYRMLIDHAGWVAGELETAVELVEEAMGTGLRVEMGTWGLLFGAFERHRGVRFGGWGRAGLGRVWGLWVGYVDWLREGGGGSVRVDGETVSAGLRAWELHGTGEEVREAVRTVREWDVGEEVEKVLERAVDGVERAEKRAEMLRLQGLGNEELSGQVRKRKGKRWKDGGGKGKGKIWNGPGVVEETEMLWPEEDPFK